MARVRLTKRFVDATGHGDLDRFLWDEDLECFGLRVRAAPSKRKVYLVQYRTGGRTRRVGIGTHGSVTLDEARRRAKELLGRIARGDDPAEELRTRRLAPTVA